MLLSACHKSAGRGPSLAAASDTAGYLPPPALVSALRGLDGAVILGGRAPADAEVRLRDPGGGAFSATANDDGSWSIQLPAASAPRMFSFEADAAGRLLHGEGAVLTLPTPGPAAVLTRAGYGALPIDGAAGPRIATIDYDGAGGGSVSGLVQPRAPVRLVLDGFAVGAGQADEKGRFAVLDLSARTTFSPGDHAVRVETRNGAVEGRITLTPSAPLNDLIFRSTRQSDGWRVDWRTPGGGVQSTVVFDASPQSSLK